MAAVRERSWVALFSGGITSTLLAVSGAAATASNHQALGALGVLGAAVGGLHSNLISARIAEQANQQLAERNHLARFGMTGALRDAAGDLEQQLRSRDGKIPEPLASFFSVWRSQLDRALNSGTNPDELIREQN